MTRAPAITTASPAAPRAAAFALASPAMVLRSLIPAPALSLLLAVLLLVGLTSPLDADDCGSLG